MKRGFTVAGFMIGISIITLLAAIAIPELLKGKMTDNESAARATLKTISAALETYAAESKQGYPTDISVLTTANPPYLNKNYIADSPIQGYNYACQFLEVNSYSCNATPQHCGRTGSRIYTITTGGVFTDTDCSQ
jgi:type II secretory pathway pseudopilin PulG